MKQSIVTNVIRNKTCSYLYDVVKITKNEVQYLRQAIDFETASSLVEALNKN
jgi:hypothetical protein